ncbi:unnamed protein product, partial [Vitis vinifera]
MENSQDDAKIFSVRIVSMDYYMAPPIPDLDICYSSFQGGMVKEVPVIRIYGSTPVGQKTCLHVHRALPYLYVPCTDLMPQSPQEADTYTHAVSLGVEKALKLKGNAGSKRQHVHGCSLVRAKNFYGYHSSEELFVKIYLNISYHPHDVSRAANLLLGGSVLDKSLQPHESHIPFLLQFLIDYNLYGMGHLHLSKMKFRHPVPDVFSSRKVNYNGQQKLEPDDFACISAHLQADSSGDTCLSSPVWISSTIPGGWMWQFSSQLDASPGQGICSPKRQSTCELEGDAIVEEILNQQFKLYSSLSQTHSDVKMVRSLIPIWEEEFERTGMHEVAMPPDPGKPLPEDVLRSLSHGLEFENKLGELCNQAEKFNQNKNISPVSQGSLCEEDDDAIPSEGRGMCLQQLSVDERQRSENIGPSGLKVADNEALGLLSWLASSQAAEDINSDDELVCQTILSPLLPTVTIDKVLEKANMDYENESQQECQDILDSVEDLADFKGLKERASCSTDHSHSPQTSLEKMIPQVDGSGDDPNDCSGNSSETEMKSETKRFSQHQVLQDTGASFSNKHKRNQSLWGSLPLTTTQKACDFNSDYSACSMYGKLPSFSSTDGSLLINISKDVQFDHCGRRDDEVGTEATAGSRNFTITGHSQMNTGTKESLQPFNTEVRDSAASMVDFEFSNCKEYACKPDPSTDVQFLKFDTGDKHFVDERLKQTKASASSCLSNSPFEHEMVFQGTILDEFIPFFVGDCQEEKKVWNKCYNDLNNHQEVGMGVPTHYQNDGSFLYLLTPVFSPPSADCVHRWLLHDDTDTSAEPLPVGSVSHVKPVLDQQNHEIHDNLNAKKNAFHDKVPEKTQVKGNIMKVKKCTNCSQDISQISGPEEKSKPTPLSQIGFRDPASVGGGQQVTLLSIEIQAESRGDLRPDPRYDAINVIVLLIQEDDDSALEVFVLCRSNIEPCQRKLDGISGCKVLVSSEEKLLFDDFINIICSFDPDILIGWDIQGGSLGFLAERASHLADEMLPENLVDDSVLLEEAIIEDEWGRTHASGVHVGGRIVLNVWRLMRGEIKLNMYTAESVAEAVLRQKIPSIRNRVLTKWFSSGPGRARYRSIEYVIQRAKLNFEIMNQLDMINRTSELARVFGIDFFSVLSRGSQYHVESMFLRLAHTQNFLAISPGPQQVATQPAMECLPLVMEPESGFYADPVVVLDFQSLYPSMIIAYNLCYSTCLGKVAPSKADVLGVSIYSPDPHALHDLKDQILLTPNGVMYVPSKARKGVLPRLLEEILSTRIMVKKAMKKLVPSQQVLQRIFNARQLALKLIANVTYGYTAAGYSGRMPCAELADSIVQCGRRTLENAISLVNTHDKWKAKVIYGDTDSMFVLLKGRTVKESFQIGHEIASAVTAMNPNPVTLKMEKVYHPCFLLTKKRYVGYSYESPDQIEPTFDAKGIETVRRDTCGAVAKTMEQSLRLFFEHQDISKVKVYLQRQWRRILSGRVSLQDFVFAKEVRLGTYSSRASSLPPAAIVAIKAMRADPRAEPCYAERVPYVVIHGEPGARLVDLVVDPLDLLAIDSPYRLNDQYYINKQIIPALQRVFGLVGADLYQWFSEMPRPVREVYAKHKSHAPNPYRTRIDFYYLSKHCILCGELSPASAHICDKCSKDGTAVAAAVIGRTAKLERDIQHLAAICRHCGGGDWIVESGVKCTSLACSVFYERRKVQKDLQGLSSVATEAGFYPKCMVEWF